MAHDAPDGVSVYDARVAASNPALEISRQHAEAAKAADNDGSGLSPQDGQQTPGSSKSTRHRNKPSLSCHTCTSKKTKVRVKFRIILPDTIGGSLVIKSSPTMSMIYLLIVRPV